MTKPKFRDKFCQRYTIIIKYYKHKPVTNNNALLALPRPPPLEVLAYLLWNSVGEPVIASKIHSGDYNMQSSKLTLIILYSVDTIISHFKNVKTETVN